MALLEMDRVDCSPGEHPVLRAFSMEIEQGEIVVLLGASGCGKTTALRAIAGFEPILGGEIRIAGRVVARPGFEIPPERRAVGLVFQDFALFPHLTVAENITLGIRKDSRSAQRQRVKEMLEKTYLGSGPGRDALEHRYPHQLSGGQQARVALARALAPRPSLLLLDEPFVGLDPALRERLSVEVHKILREVGTTALLVTHDLNEALSMGDRVGVMRGGMILQMDTPFDLYHEPLSREVAAFLNRGLFLEAELRSEHELETELGLIRSKHPHSLPEGTHMQLLLRRSDVLVDPEGPLVGVVVDKAFQGDSTMYTLELESGLRVQTITSSHHDLKYGETMRVRLDLEHVVAFPVTESPG